MSFTVDETPTPTKLIEKLEKDGVFQELGNVNPFDEQFRKATERGAHVIIHEPSSDSRRCEDVLNTPIFPVSTEQTPKFNSKQSSFLSLPSIDFLTSSTPGISESVTPDPDKGDSSQTSVVRPPKLVKQTSVIVYPPGVEPLNRIDIQADDNQNVVDTSDILFGLSNSQDITIVKDLEKKEDDPVVIEQPEKECRGLSAKEKLKQILRKEQPEDAFCMNQTQIYVNDVRRHLTMSNNFSPGDPKKRRRSGAPISDEDIDEKKRASLERNRAAAQRSRLKRKHQMMEMKKMNEVLVQENKKLKEEAALLRHDIAELKCLMLAHRDCPITKDILEGRLTVDMPVKEKQTRVPNYVNIRPAGIREEPKMIVVLPNPPGLTICPKMIDPNPSVIVGPRRAPVQQYKIVNGEASLMRRIDQ